jgi:D-alanyl-D-alanine carboxypeptidase (penicillin-binding protein 5/6)
MEANKKLYLLWALCLALIIIVLISKLSDYVNEKPELTVSKTENNTEPIETSSSFYSDEAPDQPSSKEKAVVVAQQSPVSARAYLVGNVLTGEILMMRRPDLVLPVASMSKLITAIESIDQFTLKKEFAITESELEVPDGHKFAPGEIFTVEEALYPLLLNSSNIVAEALASSSSRYAFMDLMSSYAWEIGMPATYFADPSGLSPTNVSSARDFFALARYLYKLRPDILAITKIQRISLATTTKHGYHDFISTHPFVNDPNFLGGKTGRTPSARDTMLTIMNVSGKPIAIIVLASEDRRKDTLFLLQQIKELP